MESSPQKKPGTRGKFRPLVTAAAIVVIAAGLRAAAPVFLPLLLAFFLAALSLPLVRWLDRRGVGIHVAVGITFLLAVAILVAFAVLVTGTATQFLRAAPGYTQQLLDKARAGLETLSARGIELSEWVTIERIDSGQLFEFARGILGGTVKGVTSFVSEVILVLFLLIFVLLELVGLPSKLHRALGAREGVINQVMEVTQEIQRYLGVKTLTSAIAAVFVGLWLVLLKVDFAALWAVLAFLLHYIPVIGSIIAAVPAVLVTLVQYGPGTASLVALGYLAIFIAIGNFAEPLIFGRRMGLSTLVVFMSLIFWGWVWGPLGMILSVPLTMTFKIAFAHSEDLKWVSVLLGPGSAGDAAQADENRDEDREAAPSEKEEPGAKPS